MERKRAELEAAKKLLADMALDVIFHLAQQNLNLQLLFIELVALNHDLIHPSQHFICFNNIE